MLLTLIAVLTPPIPPAVRAPPTAAPAMPIPYIVDLRPGTARCGGTAVRAMMLAEPLPIGTLGGRVEQMGPMPVYTLRFRIAADGRPMAISTVTREAVPGPSLYFDSEDLEPALAASRFESGAQADCEITYSAVATPVASAPLPQLYRFLALPRLGRAGWQEAGDRAQKESGDCFRDGAPQVLSRAYPDFRRIPQAPGTLSWTMTGFDIDSTGRPRNVRTIAAGDNAALDHAGRTASARSRYGAGSPRNGCHYSYYRRQEQPIPAPPMPERDSIRVEGARCEAKPATASPPIMVFPENFRRRAIEGWAILSYDVAPWGDVGNVKVIESQPAAAFGVAASNLVRMTRRAASLVGASGCVERVRYKIGARRDEPGFTD